MGSHGTLATVPQLCISSSPLASCAQPDPSLCQQTGVLTGNLPGPQSHSQTPAASKLRMSPLSPPFSIHSQCSRLSHRRGVVAWLLPQLARHPSCREPQTVPGLPLLSSTPPARHAHYQRAKNPTWQMLPVPSKSPAVPQAVRAQEVGESQEGFSVDQNRLKKQVCWTLSWKLRKCPLG